MVEATFTRNAAILHLHVGSQIVRTTGEHPFFAYDKGWTKASALVVGDRLLTADGSWQLVEDVHDTGEWETVYNLRVADHHTYFVGDYSWGWALWAHNVSCMQVDRTDLNWNAQVLSGHDVFGTAQNTTGAANDPHAAQVLAIVNSLAAIAPTGTYFVMNRTWRTALGRTNVPLGSAGARDRPDILIVQPLDPVGTPNRRWKIHAIEVLSGYQMPVGAIAHLEVGWLAVNKHSNEIQHGKFAAVSQTAAPPAIAW